MPEAITLKQHQAVRRVLNAFRGPRPLRQVITRESELNLRMLSEVFPNQTRALLKNLLFLKQMEGTPQKLVVPDQLYSHVNREILSRAARDLNYLLKLIDEDGVADLRRGGMHRPDLTRVIDLTPVIKKPTFTEQLSIINRAKPKLVEEQRYGRSEIGDQLLFQTLIVAQVELYYAGEARSKAIRSEDLAERRTADRDLGLVQMKFEDLLKFFPFFMEHQKQYRGKLETACQQLRDKNSTGAYATLLGLTGKISQRMQAQEEARMESYRLGLEKSLLEGKIRITNRRSGKFAVTRTAYERDEFGLIHSVLREYEYDSMHAFLRSFDHETATINEQVAKLKGKVSELRQIAADPLASYDRLLELSLGQEEGEKNLTRDHYLSLSVLKKRKAMMTLWGAERLTGISNDQARALAASLVSVAAWDYENRITEHLAQLDHIPRQVSFAAGLVQDLLVEFTSNVARYFMKRSSLSPEKLRIVLNKLGKYFSTYFKVPKGHETYPWIRQARSNLNGLLIGLRKNYGKMEYAKLARQAARQIKLIEFNFLNREKKFAPGERKYALNEFYLRQGLS